MTEKEYLLYRNIDFYNRYNCFREKYKDVEPNLEKYEVNLVLNIFKNIGYDNVRFMKSGSFFKIKEKQKPYEFYFHVSLKYGVCELIIGGENLLTKTFVGSVFGGIMRDILKFEGKEEKRFPLPGYRNYYDLKIILKESLSIYEDFKKEFIKQYN